MVIESAKDKVRGVIIGLAAGDRNGGPIRMAVRLAESLATQQRFNLEDIAERYLNWWNEGAFDTGSVVANVFKLVASGMSYQKAVTRVDYDLKGLTAGCYPADRSHPFAMASFLEDEQLPDIAVREASLTHKNTLAGDVATATVVLCRAVIRGAGWIPGLQKAAEGRALQTREALQTSSAKSLNKGGFAPDVLRAAIHFVENGANFVNALNNSMEFAGPANYSPVLVGAIGGARWGASSIPHSATADCDILTRVQNVARILADQWNWTENE